MIQSYKAVFFDAGGTLLHPFPSVGEIYRDAAARYGCVAQSEILEALFRDAWLKRDGLRTLDRQDPGSVPESSDSGLSTFASHSSEKIEREWWRGLVHEVFSQVGGICDFEAFFDELYDLFARPECWRVYPGVMEVLHELKQKKKKLGIISNWDSRLFVICSGLGLENYFEFILASAVFGASKPSPRIFEEALRRAGVDPGQAVHVGDSFEDDVKGAQAAGMQAILIERHPKHRKLENIAVIHDLKELLG